MNAQREILNNQYPVSFETKVWENDWRFILKEDYLVKLTENCNYKFSDKTIIINNVNDRRLVENRCEWLLNRGIITAFICVADHEERVLDKYDLSKELLGKGYVYSISELVSIDVCRSKYLLHFSGDSYLKKNEDSWITKSIQMMESNTDIIVANPIWNNKYREAKRESTEESEDFFIGQGFSDQCYLINADNFRHKIYNFKHPKSDRYPNYGGELFEKRVDSYMRFLNKKRITYKRLSYHSKNFSTHFLGRLLEKLYPRL